MWNTIYLRSQTFYGYTIRNLNYTLNYHVAAINQLYGLHVNLRFIYAWNHCTKNAIRFYHLNESNFWLPFTNHFWFVRNSIFYLSEDPFDDLRSKIKLTLKRACRIRLIDIFKKFKQVWYMCVCNKNKFITIFEIYNKHIILMWMLCAA